MMNKLDIKRILALNIPDIHLTYGGVRGRTMSARGQGYAWPIIKEAGVDTIIDLRNDGMNLRMSHLCEEYGMEYFYYPVDNRADMIESMVELFPAFCERIDRGGFYIACAMGLHRTDIALSTYWVFYGADHGIKPPELQGYLRESGHDTSKVLRVLNAFYDRLTAKNGHEPMSKEEFKRRKKVINEQSMKNCMEEKSMKKIVYVDMGGVLMDFHAGLASVGDEFRKEYAGRYSEIPNIVSYLPPVSGAIEAMHALQESGRYDVYILSTSPWANPTTWSDKVDWVNRYLDKYYQKRLILTHHKNLLKGNYLIDDRAKHGTSGFKGEWIKFGSEQFPDWNSVLEYLHVNIKNDNENI